MSVIVGYAVCLPSYKSRESGRVKLLRGSDWLDMYLDELKTFPFGEYDDLVDVTSMAITRMQRDSESVDFFDIAVI